jgi:hypothetical protein
MNANELDAQPDLFASTQPGQETPAPKPGEPPSPHPPEHQPKPEPDAEPKEGGDEKPAPAH